MDELHGLPVDATAPEAHSEPAPRKSQLLLVVIAVVVLVAIIGGTFAWVSFTRSPAYSLGQLAASVQEKNWDGVQKYVDIDSVVGRAVDDVMGKALKEDSSGMGALAAGLAQSMKPALVQQAKESFKTSIEDGSSSSSGGQVGSFGSYFASKNIKSTTYIGDEALVTIEVPNEDGKSFDLRLKMKRVDNFWRVTAIENLVDLPAASGK